MSSPKQNQNRGMGRQDDQGIGSQLPAGKSCFLGIGIDAYRHFSQLHNAVRDMETISRLLISDYDLHEDNCRWICNEEATRRGMLRSLRSLDHWVDKDDKLIIYYSGHGHLNRHQRGFWVPVDAEQGAEEDYVSNAVLREIIADIPARHILLISDSCFSGTLFVRAAMRADVAAAELEKIPSRWALCSGRHDQLVADGPQNGHSPFAESILKELRRNSGHTLRIGTLADRVIELTSANYDQLPEGNPLQGVGHLGGQYVFRRSLRETPDAWDKIWQLPDEQLSEVNSKLEQVFDFCTRYSDSVYYENALRLGHDLELKRTLLTNYDSVFGLLKLVRENTPYRTAAEKRIKELRAQQNTNQSTEEEQAKPKTSRTKKIAPIKPTSAAVRSEDNTCNLWTVNKAYVPRGILSGTVSDYRLIKMNDIWSNSVVDSIYIRDIVASRIDRFVFYENKQLVERRGDPIPEIGGWILGRKVKLESNNYVLSFERFIQIYSSTQFDFDHEAWQTLEKAKDLFRDEDLELIGWFHTHPGWGVFLSGDDINAHNTIFNKPYHVAMVLESVKEPYEVGFFSRKQVNGELVMNNRSSIYHHWRDFRNWLQGTEK